LASLAVRLFAIHLIPPPDDGPPNIRNRVD